MGPRDITRWPVVYWGTRCLLLLWGIVVVEGTHAIGECSWYNKRGWDGMLPPSKVIVA